jgi:1-deoxy-D-xylulose-5-phosphate reductoisomerase
VGIAGLEPTLAAVERGIDVALANKESLVAAGELVVRLAGATGARLLPVDSEHSALWQCVQGLGVGAPPIEHPTGVERMILTASGGALRGWARERIDRATPAEALAHPTWRMGPKVTVDTASLMNKGFEVMEARWFFGLPPERIGVLIHPTSTVHSLVEFTDGAMLAQLGTPDMRTAIRHALMRGRRTGAASPERLDLARMGSMEFAEPDPQRFPLLELAYAALRRGGTAGATLNAANERAVAAFLHPANADGSRMRFGRIAEVVAEVIESSPVRPVAGLADVLKADAAAREAADRLLGA